MTLIILKVDVFAYIAYKVCNEVSYLAKLDSLPCKYEWPLLGGHLVTASAMAPLQKRHKEGRKFETGRGNRVTRTIVKQYTHPMPMEGRMDKTGVVECI